MLIEVFKNMDYAEEILTILMIKIIERRLKDNPNHELITLDRDLRDCMPASDMSAGNSEYVSTQVQCYKNHGNDLDIVRAYIEFCHIDIPNWGITEMIKKEFQLK